MSTVCPHVAGTAEAQDPDDDPSRLTRLSEAMVHDGERARLLTLAAAEVEAGRMQNAVESLRRVLEAPHDAFGHAPAQLTQSLRTQALELLRRSPPSLRNAWRTALEPAAAAELREAIQQRSHRRLQDVARRYPLTDAGFRADVLRTTHIVLTSDPAAATACVEDVSRTWFGTRFGDRAAEAARRWSRLMHSRPAATGRRDAQFVHRPVSRRAPDVTVTRPWPVSLWSWRESAADAEPRVQQVISEVQSGQSGPQGEGPDFSSWCTLNWSGLVVHRSPLRIIAFHPNTGVPAWEIPTDTLPPNSADIHPAGSVPLLPVPSRFDACGAIAADTDRLYFLDGYNLLPEQSPLSRRRYLNPGNQLIGEMDTLAEPQSRLRNSTLGQRLVALTRSADGPPRIAWIAGQAPELPYRPQLPAGPQQRPSAGAPAAEQQGDPLLKEHLFYSVPVGQFQHLYVLTVAWEQVWLNCLHKADGSVIWQQPVCMKPDSLFGVTGGLTAVAPQAHCLQSGNSVICCIPDGPVISVAAHSGQLNWATTTDDRSRQRRMRRFGLNIPEQLSSSEFLPLIVGDRLIWSSPVSRDVHCIDLVSAQTLWTVSRTASGPGSISASEDRYALGTAGGAIVLVGDHHCRTLDLRTGEQLWSAELKSQSGRGVIDGRIALIPEHHGSLTRIDLRDGAIDRVSPQFRPSGAEAVDGAISIDAQYVRIATPVRVAQFPRADLLAGPDRVTTADSDPVQWALAARLANGRAAALDVLTDAARRHTPSDSADRLHELTAELILQDVAGRVFAAPASDDTEPHDVRGEPQWRFLSELQLAPAQQVRSRLIERTLAARTGTRPSAVPDAESALQGAAWRTPQSIDGEWQVRPDLLLWEEFRRAGQAGDVIARSDRDDPVGADSVLLAGAAADPRRDADRVRQLDARGRTAAAEALAVVAARQSMDAAHHEQFASLIQTLRHRPLRGESDRPTETHPAARTYVIQERQVQQHAPSEFPSVANGRLLPESARQPGIRVYLSDRENGRSIRSIDLRTGALLSSVDPGFRAEFPDIALPSLADCGLIAVKGDQHLAVLYCRADGALQLLWKRRIGLVEGESLVKRVGACGPDYLIWQSESRLHCCHPLTGEDLWTRDLTYADSGGLIIGFPMLFGDDRVTVVVDSDQSSCQVYSTRDGRSMGRVPLDFDRTQTVLAIGRRLVGVRTGTLKLSIRDLADQSELLDQREGIELAGDSTFRLLPSGRLVAVTREKDIIVLSPETGDVTMRVSVAGTLNTGFVFGFTAFERSGRLLVAINDERAFGEAISAPARLGEPRCDFGRLYCLDPEQQAIAWSRRTEPSVFTQVNGVDVLVGWSVVARDRGSQRRTGMRMLRLQLIDLHTGHLVGAHDGLNLDMPVSVTRDPQSGDLHIATVASEIIASPAAKWPHRM